MTIMTVNNHYEQGRDHRSQRRDQIDDEAVQPIRVLFSACK
jgi:hypothetical protein